MNFDFSKYNKILDVGCGGHPLEQATHYCDAHLDNQSRGTNLGIDPDDPRFKIANLDDKLPYDDKEFDFIWCSHVLEHVKDPEIACKELMRIGREGYIETPTLMWEKLFGRTYHLWIVETDFHTIHFTKKTAVECPHNNFNGDWLYANVPEFHKMFHENVNLFYNQFHWIGDFYYNVIK